MRIVVIGNYPPRKCGIATFTENFVNSLNSIEDLNNDKKLHIEVIAMNDPETNYDYPGIVTKKIRQEQIEDYQNAIDYINSNGFTICHIQHEYGIFGGTSGIYILRFLAQIKIPIVITLHTVPKTPNYYQRQIIYTFGLKACKIITMNPLAVDILNEIYQIDKKRVAIIEHGVPEFLPYDKVEAKVELGWQNNMVLMTFGLLGRSKGIETALKALPEICARFPKLIYVVLGSLHPHVIRHEGYAYIDELKKLASELGIDDKVIFKDEYVGEQKLMAYLKATDIYITPYINENQITSGTLSYAVSAGTAVVSTPYLHAKQLLINEKGCLFNFYDSAGLKKVLLKLLTDSDYRTRLQANGFDHGQKITWTKTGKEYLDIYYSVAQDTKINSIPIQNVLLKFLPPFSLEHFNRITDQTGILQHARFIFPDYTYGYTTDDNARALLMSTMLYRYKPSENAKNLILKFLSYLSYMQLPDGRFLNFMDYNKKIHNGDLSEDAFGRSIWALAYLMRFSKDDNYFEFARELFLKASVQFKQMTSLRGMANTIIGMSHYLKILPHDTGIKDFFTYQISSLEDAYKHHSKEDWVWFEEKLSYDNAILPLAFLYASEFEAYDKYFLYAEKSMQFLEKLILKDGRFSLIGNDPWMEKGKRKSDFSQQPIDASILVIYYAKAFSLTKKNTYLVKHRIALSWFLGNNDAFIPLYDDQSKGCSDGLFQDSVNRNQGAESLLAWLISYLMNKLIHLPG